MLRAGILGVSGSMGKCHKKRYDMIAEENGFVKLEACFDISTDKLEEVSDLRTYTDIDEFLENEKGKLDYIDICLPTFLHAEIAIKAMKSGFNVLCEKPMALNSEDAFEMCRVSKETGKKLMIAHCMRFSGFYKAVKELCESGELGKMSSVEFHRQSGNIGLYGNGGTTWFGNEKLSGGMILDLHIHDADMMIGLFGIPDAVSAIASSNLPSGGYNAMSINYMYNDRSFVNAHANTTLPYNKFNGRTFRVNFEKGYVYRNIWDDEVFIRVNCDGTEINLNDRFSNDSYYDEIMYFADCVANDKSLDFCPPEESAEAIRVVKCAVKSADGLGEKINIK